METIGIQEQHAFAKCSESCYCLELIRFFAAHPSTSFNRLAVIRFQDPNNPGLEVERALEHLISYGIIRATLVNDEYLFSLTEDESRRKWVLEQAKLEWRRFRLPFNSAAVRLYNTVNVKMALV